MITIHKHAVFLGDTFTIELPQGAQFLSLQMQHGKPQMWFVLTILARYVGRSSVSAGLVMRYPRKCQPRHFLELSRWTMAPW